MTSRKPSANVSKIHFAKPRQNVRHFGISMCREVRQAHFKSLFYIVALGFTILGLIAWLGQ